MSDIQSIANGTYVIGETSATNFIAGNGIKIDSPSAGTVRIGNDETVLWDTSGNSWTGSVTASEPFSGFERVKVLFGRGYDNCNYCEFPGNAQNWDCYSRIQATTCILNYGLYHISGGISAIQNGNLRWTLRTDNTVKYEGTAFPNSIYKVIGINRISGGNA